MASLWAVGNHTAKPLFAQIKAALVQNVDEPGRNPYTSTVFFASDLFSSCTGPECRVNFAAVPAGKRLVATSLAGNIYVETPGVVGSTLLFPLGNEAGGTTLSVPMLPQAGPASGANIIGVNVQLKAYFEPGYTPEMVIDATNSISPHRNGLTEGVLTLTGYLVTP
jgi:hypothetical protein